MLIKKYTKTKSETPAKIATKKGRNNERGEFDRDTIFD